MRRRRIGSACFPGERTPSRICIPRLVGGCRDITVQTSHRLVASAERGAANRRPGDVMRAKAGRRFVRRIDDSHGRVPCSHSRTRAGARPQRGLGRGADPVGPGPRPTGRSGYKGRADGEEPASEPSPAPPGKSPLRGARNRRARSGRRANIAFGFARGGERTSMDGQPSRRRLSGGCRPGAAISSQSCPRSKPAFRPQRWLAEPMRGRR